MPDTQNLDAAAFNEQDAALREQFRPPLDGVTALFLRRQNLHARALAGMLQRQGEEIADLHRRLEAAEAALRHHAPALQAAWMHVPIGTARLGTPQGVAADAGGDGCGS